ncbi:signal recognition particle [Pseudovibrio denitrificans]|uniref:signal recognition particle n=1 Tax=Pseudovibrio denitrificans TaxID=258256 RepID=UPI0039BFC94A
MKHIILAAAATLILTSASQAEDSWEIAENLGILLGSEEACDLSFKQEPIEKFIEANVSPGDMDFVGDLDMIVENTETDMREMSTKKIARHCIQIKRTAKHYGFID